MAEMRRKMHFAGGGLPEDTLEVVSFTGKEEISRLFRFDLELASKTEDIDFTAMLTEPACLAVKQGVALSGGGRGVQTLKIHGVLASFEQHEKGFDWVRYRAVLVPKLWRSSLNRQSQIYLDMNVPEIIEEELRRAGFTDDDFEFRTNAREYPKREYVVQYLESDLDFISRLCEHEGIFFYYEHQEDTAKIIFGDAPEAYGTIQGNGNVRYMPTSAEDARVEDTEEESWFTEEVVQSLSCGQRMIPQKVILKDYNYRTPSTILTVEAPVVPDGIGTAYYYGEHYKDTDEGQVYAGIRAEEIRCRRRLFLGTSDVRSFRAGHTYTLSEHYRGNFNMPYLITEVRHEASQPIELVTPSSVAVASYRNEFASIPAEEVFRSERVTPKPRVAGLLNATVDSSGDGQYAEINEEGEYKVKVPFDRSDRVGGNASRFIRKAEVYAGPGMGMHCPLHKGTEVILGHVNGDPNRPVIVAAVTNPETRSPVTGNNQTQCALRTGGGNDVTVEDADGGQRITIYSPTSGTVFSMGAPGG